MYNLALSKALAIGCPPNPETPNFRDSNNLTLLLIILELPDISRSQLFLSQLLMLKTAGISLSTSGLVYGNVGYRAWGLQAVRLCSDLVRPCSAWEGLASGGNLSLKWPCISCPLWVSQTWGILGIVLYTCIFRPAGYDGADGWIDGWEKGICEKGVFFFRSSQSSTK